MRSEHQKRVDKFHKLAGQNDPVTPTVPSLEVRQLRAKLILEEALETVDALGFAVYSKSDTDYDHNFAEEDYLKITAYKPPDLEKIADGCWDTIVVTTGTLSSCGIDDMEGQEEVDNNNLAKFGPGGHRREDGKWIKPPNHKKPDIKRILASQAHV